MPTREQQQRLWRENDITTEELQKLTNAILSRQFASLLIDIGSIKVGQIEFKKRFKGSYHNHWFRTHTPEFRRIIKYLRKFIPLEDEDISFSTLLYNLAQLINMLADYWKIIEENNRYPNGYYSRPARPRIMQEDPEVVEKRNVPRRKGYMEQRAEERRNLTNG